MFILQFSLQGRKKSRTEDLSNDDENAGEQEEGVEGAEEEDDGRRAINYTVSCLNSYDVCLSCVFGRIALNFQPNSRTFLKLTKFSSLQTLLTDCEE